VRRNSTRDRRDCVERHAYERDGRTYMQCHICRGEIDLATTSWEAEHPVMYALGGKEVWPAHWRCHRTKTATDVSALAKGKRARDRNLGRGRRTAWKKKLNGEVERR